MVEKIKKFRKLVQGVDFRCLCKDAPSPKNIVSSGEGVSVYMLGLLATFGK